MKYGKGIFFERWQWAKIKSTAGETDFHTLQEYARSRTQLVWELPEMVEKNWC